ncbi:hemolymph lipopolysaccharide-binding protein [Anabrus simplex]|uniref:hemolymph lipopolysaccharide-binding protein n=1 Tax=Anabrus simplex TaxID=316456 RepID=UPI0035A307BD
MLLLPLLSLSVLVLQICRAQECPQTAKSGMLTLISRRNLTGHWNVEVRLEHFATRELEDRRAGPWQVTVNHGTTGCDGGDVAFVQAILTAPIPKPGPGYELFPGVGYFKYHSTAKTWEKARNTCLQEGAHLAVVNSERESQYMVQVMRHHQSQIAYIGFHDRFVEGEFLTVLGTSLNSTGFTRWADKRLPDNGGNIPEPGADCGAIYINGGLHDVGCQGSLAFFCEGME